MLFRQDFSLLYRGVARGRGGVVGIMDMDVKWNGPFSCLQLGYKMACSLTLNSKKNNNTKVLQVLLIFINHKNYNFLDFDWFKKTSVFHSFTCQIVMGQFVIGQFVISSSISQSHSKVQFKSTNHIQSCSYVHVCFCMCMRACLLECVFLVPNCRQEARFP